MNDDGDVEEELRSALIGEERSVVEPAGLADRLVDYARRPSHPHRVRWRATGWLPLVASAAALVIVAAGVAVTRSALLESRHAPGTSVPLPSRTAAEPTSGAPSSPTGSPTSSTSSLHPHPPAVPPPATSRSAGGDPSCSTGRSHEDSSTITVCPAAARTGDAVTITLHGRCGGTGPGPTLVFLGPHVYIGSEGGGTEIPLTATGTGFRARFTVPVTATPGRGFSFSTYPAGSCTAPFRVRAGGPTPPAGSEPWSAPQLLITERSLGAVRRGMSSAAAEQAAGVPLAGIGDGIVRPTNASTGGSTQLQYSWGTTCFDAFRSRSGSGTRVVTPTGVGLGDPMSRVLSAYPNATQFTADPNWGGPGNVKGGLLVRFDDGVLLFVGTSPDLRGGTVSSIRGAPTARTASSYFC